MERVIDYKEYLGRSLVKTMILMFSLTALLLLSGANELSAQCNWIPNGVSTTPAWTPGTPNTRVHITASCWVEYEWCYRTVNGKKEIILGRQVVSGSTPWWWFSSCLNEYNKKKALMHDRAVSVIVNQMNIFGDGSISECPNYNNKFYDVYSAKCLSEAYYEWTTQGGRLVKSPCNTEGYCKYEYKYCYVINNGVQYSTFQRTLITTGGTECPGDYYEPITQQTYDCYPGDCFPSTTKKKDPTDSDVLNYEDTYYLNQFDITNIANW
ncbi:MAG: hypothetical protein WC121_06510 [Candidatus Kapaibacterium sp.]